MEQNSERTSAAGAYPSSRPSVGDAINSGKQAISSAASSAATSAASDFENLRNDMNSLKETVSQFIAKSSGEAVKAAGEVSSTLMQQAGEQGSKLATAVSAQAKTFAATLEETGRKHPLGSMGAALAVGMLIALLGRSRS